MLDERVNDDVHRAKNAFGCPFSELKQIDVFWLLEFVMDFVSMFTLPPDTLTVTGEYALPVGAAYVPFCVTLSGSTSISVGSTVFGGMVAAATIGTLLTPVFYVLVQSLVDYTYNKRLEKQHVTD